MRSLRPLLVLALGLSLAGTTGCKRHPAGTTCDAVGARFLTLARADLDAAAGLDAATRRGVAGLLPPMRDAMVRACREGHWSAEARACYAAAVDSTALGACEAQLSDAQREAVRKAAARGAE